MEQIPIFTGEKSDLDSWLTCGLFLSIIEDHANENNLTEDQLKELCLFKSSDIALELLQRHQDQSWTDLKNLMFDEFPVKLSIRDKVEIRKKLQQQESESVDEFYQRCLQAQYLVSDDTKDVGFEREVLLHFLVGLTPFIRDLVLATKCSSNNEYVREAKKYVQIVKEEPMEADVKIETEILDEEFDAKNDLDEYDVKNSFENYDYSYEEEESEQTEWICIKCDKSFSANQKLKMHSQTLHKICAKCDKTFVNKAKHYEMWHSKVECNLCEYTCKNKNLLKLHIKENHNSDKRVSSKNIGRCRICNEDFESKDVRLEHEENEHGHLKQTCEKCNEVCPTIKHLASHIAYKHCAKNEGGNTVCLYCTISRKRPLDLSYHIMNKHFNQPNYKCSQCGRGFDTKSDHENHLKTMHNEDRESFQCDKCPKSFKTLLGMNLHVRNIHIGETEAKCKDCDKTFANARYLKNHQRLMHSGERTKWICDDCGKSFTSKQLFKNHILRVHVNPEEKDKQMHVCTHPGCTKSFLTKDTFSRHFKRVHLKEKRHLCTLCPKGFFSKRMFDEHTNGVHLNVKPFQCEMCEFATAYSARIREHQKVAHGNQKFDCPHCPHTARYKNNLDKHINNVHKNLFMIDQ